MAGVAPEAPASEVVFYDISGDAGSQKPTGKLLLGDSINRMQSLPAGSIKAVVTSPPYNIKNSTGNGLKNGRGGKWENAALQKG